MLCSSILLCLCLQATCWHEHGHYATAYIAQEYLLAHRPQALEWAKKLLEPLADECGEGNYQFIEAATWADKARGNGWRLLMYHHFVSIPWFDGGAEPIKYFPEKFANVTYGIEESIRHLKTAQDDKMGKSFAILGQGISLRLLMHFVGDIHQPLHASERITPAKPNGDMGGNLFKIHHFGDRIKDNLHYLWDTMFESSRLTHFHGTLTSSGYYVLKEWVKGIMKEYPLKKVYQKLSKNTSPMSWALESHAIAKRRVYTKNLVEFGEIPEDYIKIGKHICRTRIAFAGYRLGMVIENIYNSLYPEEPKQDL